MLLRVVRPMKRSESSKHYFRQRIPLDVLDKARGAVVSLPIGDEIIVRTIPPKATVVKVSLRTSDPSEVKTRQGIAAASLEAFWQSLRNGPSVLSHKQCVALSGELFSAFVEAAEDNPGDAALWAKVKADNDAAQRGTLGTAQLMIPGPERTRQSLERRFGGLLDVLLAKRGLVVDDESRSRLLEQAAKAMSDAAGKIGKFAKGDYSEDDVAKRFPKWEDAPKSAPAKTPAVSITGLFDGWWKEAQVSGRGESTRDGYARTIAYFREFLGHDDATRVTHDDVIAFKDHRLHEINPRTGKPASPKTVKDSDLAAIKSVFGWGQANNKIAANPANGVTVKIGKKVLNRPKYFKPDERKAILELARDYRPEGRERAKLTLAKRWVPWICAYTGARVGEIAQLRKQDVRQEEGYWIFHITPDAGTVKNKEAREVPIHAHLVEQGFLDMVAASSDGYIFIDVKPGSSPTGKVRTLKNDLAEFVRTVVPDPDIQPNHGWRHTFKTVAWEVEGINSNVVDAITGHAARTEGDGYGAKTIKAKAIVMKLFPRLLP